MFRSAFLLVFVFTVAALGGCATVTRDANGNSSCSGWGCAGAVVRPAYGTYGGSYAPIYGVQGGYRYREPVVQIGQIIGRSDLREATVNGTYRVCSVDARSPYSCGDPRNAPNWPHR